MHGERWRRRLAAVALGLALVMAVASIAYRGALTRPYAGWEGPFVDVVLEPGLGAGEMLSRLAGHGVLRHPWALKSWLRVNGGSRALHAGEYRFDEPLSALDVVRRLESGDVLLHAVTIPEGLTARSVAERIAAAGLGQRDALLAAFDDPSGLPEPHVGVQSLEGYLFPDTYYFARNVSAAEVAATMVARFGEVVDERFRQAATDVGLTVHQAVTLASLIEKETSLGTERRRVSRVFHNRLARKMRLQCDPTVRYALEREGRFVERLSYRDLEFDSPWNTYVVRGLPPGPIANPGQASLEAAVAPSEGEELYFVASPDGGHRFSLDLQSHERAVAEWRRHSRSRSQE